SIAPDACTDHTPSKKRPGHPAHHKMTSSLTPFPVLFDTLDSMPYHDSENLAIPHTNGLPIVLNRWLVWSKHTSQHPNGLPIEHKEPQNALPNCFTCVTSVTPCHTGYEVIDPGVSVHPHSCHNIRSWPN
ncbi:MAG TPA: hypothetical protein VEP90_18005, partial [Methylomirabilota bacterium]|nr:hypothetical protein [Methylomirabilota bacterium]